MYWASIEGLQTRSVALQVKDAKIAHLIKCREEVDLERKDLSARLAGQDLLYKEEEKRHQAVKKELAKLKKKQGSANTVRRVPFVVGLVCLYQLLCTTSLQDPQ